MMLTREEQAYETHDWHVRQDSTNHRGEPVMIQVCKRCGATPSQVHLFNKECIEFDD